MIGEKLLPFDEFVEVLKRVCYPRYHHLHPFKRMMREGKLTPGQLRAWAVNRTCYQMVVPRKDAAILSNCPFPKERSKIVQWVLDHDTASDGRSSTGFELWLKFTEGLGLSREQVLMADILPGVRFACSSYLHFCQTRSWIEGLASSLTKMFASDVMWERVKALKKHYPWIPAEAYEYWEWRIEAEPKDTEEALAILRNYVRTPEDQRRCLEALIFKTEVLWSQLDAIYLEYVLKNDGKTPYDD